MAVEIVNEAEGDGGIDNARRMMAVIKWEFVGGGVPHLMGDAKKRRRKLISTGSRRRRV